MLALLLALALLVPLPGSSNVYTDGVHTWAGNPFCAEAGFLLQPASPAIDAGAVISGFHCPLAGMDPSGCVEWFGLAPDIGACEYVPPLIPNAPTGLNVTRI